jgi:hypothetical protein
MLALGTVLPVPSSDLSRELEYPIDPENGLYVWLDLGENRLHESPPLTPRD